MAPAKQIENLTLSAESWQQLCEFLLELNGLRSLDKIQTATLDFLQRAIPHRISMFDLARTGAHGETEYILPASTTMSTEALCAYYERYAAMDYTTWSFDMRHVNVYRDLDLVDVSRRDNTPIYLEWMEPQGVYFGTSAILASAETPLGTVTLFREKEAGDFTDAELCLLKETARHVSVRLHDLFPTAQFEQAEDSGSSLAALAKVHGLNRRETEVLELMAGGSTNSEMAQTLFISESTVKKHVNAIYRKFAVKNRMGLMNALSKPASQ